MLRLSSAGGCPAKRREAGFGPQAGTMAGPISRPEPVPFGPAPTLIAAIVCAPIVLSFLPQALDSAMSLPRNPQRVLLIRPSALGDVCRSVAVLASLRDAYPQATIDWVVQEEFAPAVAAHPALNQVIGFPRSRLARWWKDPRALAEAVRWFGNLRRRKYDLAIDCQGLGRSGLMCFATGAPIRAGLRSAREFGWLGYNLRLPRDRSTPLPVHTVDQMLLVIKEFGITPLRDLRLYAGEQDRAWWQSQRAAWREPQSPYAVIAPTSRWLSKRWPIERFAQLIEPLAARGFGCVCVIGSPGEAEQVQPLFAPSVSSSVAPGFLVNLVGQTTIGQTMAVIAQAGLVIANDSAPLHMGVGFDRPCVGLFGPTDPAAVGPYQRDDAVVRGYHASPGETINFKDPKLGDSLMRFISTVAVVQGIDRALAHSSRRSGETAATAHTAAKAVS